MLQAKEGRGGELAFPQIHGHIASLKREMHTIFMREMCCCRCPKLLQKTSSATQKEEEGRLKGEEKYKRGRYKREKKKRRRRFSQALPPFWWR